jgi:hypothetical protein
MIEKKNNIFIVNTPFQFEMCLLLIDLYFKNDKNIILSTLNKKKLNDDSFYQVINVRRNFFIIIDFLKFKFLLNKKIKNKKIINFYFPHMNNLFSSYCYNKSINNDKLKLNCYYEGVAMLYDPVVEISILQKFKRFIISLLTGHIYVHYSKLYPDFLRNNSIAYSPIKKHTSYFKEIIEFNFKSKKTNSSKKILFFLIGELDNKENLINNISRFKELINQIHFEIYNTILLKPHFNSKKEFIVKLIEELNITNFNFQLIDKNITMETICLDELNTKIISLERTSALINLRLMYQNIDLNINKNYDPTNFFDYILKDLGVNFIND